MESSNHGARPCKKMFRLQLWKWQFEDFISLTIHVWCICLHLVDFMVYVGKYTTHGFYGYGEIL